MIYEIKSARWKSCLSYILSSTCGPIVRNIFELNVSSGMVANCYSFCNKKIETFHIHMIGDLGKMVDMYELKEQNNG